MAKWIEFRQCPGCGFDIGTGEGERGCAWGECPYLPEALDVRCENCGFNYFTQEGNPPCADPMTCEHAAVPLSHVENYRRWVANLTGVEPPGPSGARDGARGGAVPTDDR